MTKFDQARDRATPAATLATLATDPDWAVRQGVARNTSSPAATLATLASDPSVAVRNGVASNSATPAATLATLATEVERARAIVAQMYREHGELVRADAVMAGDVVYRGAVDTVVYALRNAK